MSNELESDGLTPAQRNIITSGIGIVIAVIIVAVFGYLISDTPTMQPPIDETPIAQDDSTLFQTMDTLSVEPDTTVVPEPYLERGEL